MSLSSAWCVELSVGYPVWGLPCPSVGEVALELHLRVCGLRYELRRSCYPYCTSTGRVCPLPVLRDRHIAAAPLSAAVEYVRLHYCDLDERRSAADRASLTAYRQLLLSLDEPLLALVHLQPSLHAAVIAQYGSGLSLPHSAYLRWKRRREVARLQQERAELRGVASCAAAICHTLTAFNALLEQSAFPFLLSAQPSSADVLLAAYVAFIHRVPTASRSAGGGEVAMPLPSLLSDCPLLLVHAASMFERYFPAFAFSGPPLSSQDSSNGVVSAAPMSRSSVERQYRSRWERWRRIGSSAAATEDDDALIAAVAVADRRARRCEQPVLPSSYRPAPLAVRGGDEWRAAVESALSDEERQARSRQRNRYAVIGGAVAVFAFALYKRSTT